MVRNVVLNFNFANDKGTRIFGQLYLCEKDGVLYKPNKVLLSSGVFDLDYENNKSDNAANIRKQKSEIIKKYTKVVKGSIYAEIQEPFWISTEPVGIVKLLTILYGYHGNKNGKILADEENIRNLRLGKLFQRLKTLKVDHPLEVISWEKFSRENNEYIQMLLAAYALKISASDLKNGEENE